MSFVNISVDVDIADFVNSVEMDELADELDASDIFNGFGVDVFMNGLSNGDLDEILEWMIEEKEEDVAKELVEVVDPDDLIDLIVKTHDMSKEELLELVNGMYADVKEAN